MASFLESAGPGIFDTIVNNWQANERQNDAQAFSADQFARRYQITTADMKAAGLNPMLAYNQGGGNPPTSAAASAAGSNIAGGIAQSKIANAQEANLAAQTRKTIAEAAVTELYGIQQAEATLQSTLANSGLTAAQTAKVRADTDNSVAQLNNIKLEGDRLVRASELLYQQSNLAYSQSMTESQRYEMLRAQANLFAVQARLGALDEKAANALENSGRIGKEIKPFFDMLRSILRK